MSGAGRSTAAKVLEDLGWFVVDNLPPSLIPTMVDLAARTQGSVPRIAVVVDVRGRSFFEHLHEALEQMDSGGLRHRIVFLESADDVLVRRFENVRRPHPLQGEGRITDGIARERELLRELRGEADLVLDTSSRNVHELRAVLESVFSGSAETELRATVMSFGFKYGLPVDADLVVDCRFLPNPHWIPELRPRTGLDREVSEYVLAQPGAKDLLESYSEVLRTITAGYRREGKRYLTLAVGCTGGKHRSVAMAEQIGAKQTLGLDNAHGAWFLLQTKKSIVFQDRDPLEVAQEAVNAGESFNRDQYRWRVRRRFNTAVIESRYVFRGN